MRTLTFVLLCLFVLLAVSVADAKRHRRYTYVHERGLKNLLGKKKEEEKEKKSILEKVADAHRKKKEEDMTFGQKVKSRVKSAVTKGAIKKLVGKKE